jgi:hypothetical protein
MKDGMFAVSILGDPVVWIFSRKPPALLQHTNPERQVTRFGSLGSIPEAKRIAKNLDQGQSLFSNNPNRYDTSRSGGVVYLVEVQYIFRLETGQVK